MKNSNTVMDWTDERKDELRQFVAQGTSGRAIADHYSKTLNMLCTRNMVIGQIYRLGLSKKRNTISIRSVMDRKKKEAKEGERRAIRNGRLKPMRWQIPDIGAPVPLNIPTGDLELFHCKAVMDGTGDYCEPLYCGHHAPDQRWCDYHYAKFVRRVQL